MYGLRRTTEPVNPALDLAAVRDHLRLYDDTQDNFLRDVLIPAVAQAAELATHRQLITATWQLTLDRFPCAGRPLYLPVPRLQELTSIAYDDTAGDEQTWAEADYRVVTAKEPAEVWPAPTRTWPQTRCQAGAVRATFEAGYGDTWQSIPPLLRSGMLLHVGHLYMNRASVLTGTIATELPMATREIYQAFAVGDDYLEYYR